MIKLRRLRTPLMSTAVLLLALAGWYGWWLLAGTLLQQSIDGLSAAERQRGGSVSFGGLELSGFPFSVRAEFSDVAVSRFDGSGWRSPRLIADAPLWWLPAVKVRLIGTQHIRLPAGMEATTATALDGEGDLTLGGASGLTAARLALSGVTLLPAGAAIDHFEISAKLPAKQPVNGGETGLTLTASAEGVHLAAAVEPLGPRIERLALGVRLQGRLPAPAPVALAAWSRSGGSLLIDGASLSWGALSVETTGALELDRELQPTGSLTTEVTGFVPALEALAATGWIRPKDAQTFQAVLTGFAHRRDSKDLTLPRETKDKAVVKLPVSLHDHFVHIGPFRLTPLPVVVWLGDQRMPNQTTEAPPAIRQ